MIIAAGLAAHTDVYPAPPFSFRETIPPNTLALAAATRRRLATTA